jgi:hypothetical protein
MTGKLIEKCKEGCMTLANTVNRGFNYVLSFVGFCLLVWSIYSLAKNGWVLSTALKGMLITATLQFLLCFYFAWKGHKITWFIKCYHVILGVLILANIVVIVLCLDKTLRETVVKDTIAKIGGETASETISSNYLVSGYIMLSITVMEIICLMFSICRRNDLIRKRKYNKLNEDEDDLSAYYVQMGSSFDNTGLNRKLIMSEREEHGWLHKKGNDAFNAQWKKRWFVMEDDSMVYYESPESKKPQGSIVLTGLRCMRAEPEKRKVKS